MEKLQFETKSEGQCMLVRTDVFPQAYRCKLILNPKYHYRLYLIVNSENINLGILALQTKTRPDTSPHIMFYDTTSNSDLLTRSLTTLVNHVFETLLYDSVSFDLSK